MRTFKTEAVIIKRRSYGESDRILTVFSKTHGKLHIKASGVRKITSRRSPHVELLNHTKLTLYSGKTYPVLVEAESIENFSSIKENLQKIGFAYHICELIDGLCPEREEQETIFHLLINTLDHLGSTENITSIIHSFEVELLTLLGYWRGEVQVAQTLDTEHMIENIIERKLKSRNIFGKM